MEFVIIKDDTMTRNQSVQLSLRRMQARLSVRNPAAQRQAPSLTPPLASWSARGSSSWRARS